MLTHGVKYCIIFSVTNTQKGYDIVVNFIVGLIVGSSLGLFFMALITVGREEDKMIRQDELLSIDELIKELREQQKGDK